MKKNQKSKIAYVDSSAGENLAKTIPATKTIIHNEKTYYCHPIYTNYGSSKDGYIINRKRLIPRKGILHLTGYLQTSVCNQNGIKIFSAHRFIWEAVNQQLIPDGYQIHHINNDKQNNSIENLELITQQQNMIYEGKNRLGKTPSKPQNVEIKCDVFHYHHIYTNFGANKYEEAKT